MSGRLDVAKLYEAMNAKRALLGVSWREVARQTGVPASLISRMKNGQLRPGVDNFIVFVQWLGEPAETFMIP